MKRFRFIILFFISVLCYGQDVDSLRMTACGKQLQTFYLGMDVLHKWQSGQHINWLTGEPDDPDAVSGIRTHCSAFVAAACERRGIYILRPPEHQQELLANAQVKWLTSDQARGFGWHPIKEHVLFEAQKIADQGYMVVACAQNPDRHKPGHIALVMPTNLSLQQLQQSGPVMIQSSTTNSVNALFRDAFRRHIADWNSVADDVLFFYNDKLCCPADNNR